MTAQIYAFAPRKRGGVQTHATREERTNERQRRWKRWRRAVTLVEYWRHLRHLVLTAASLHQHHGEAIGQAYLKIDDRTVLDQLREAQVELLLTPAPTKGELLIKRKMGLDYLPADLSTVMAAIAADEAYLAAHARPQKAAR